MSKRCKLDIIDKNGNSILHYSVAGNCIKNVQNYIPIDKSTVRDLSLITKLLLKNKLIDPNVRNKF